MTGSHVIDASRVEWRSEVVIAPLAVTDLVPSSVALHRAWLVTFLRARLENAPTCIRAAALSDAPLHAPSVDG